MTGYLPVDTLPRNGTVIAVLTATENGFQVDALQYGWDEDGKAAWWVPGLHGIHDFAEDFDVRIVGWHPLPQLPQWTEPLWDGESADEPLPSPAQRLEAALAEYRFKLPGAGGLSGDLSIAPAWRREIVSLAVAILGAEPTQQPKEGVSQ